MPAVIAYLILVAAVLIVGCLRSWRMGLSMDNHGVTIRNYFRTYRAGWGEVSRFADGAVNPGGGGRPWAVPPASLQNPTGRWPAEKIRVLLGVGRDGSEMTTHDATRAVSAATPKRPDKETVAGSHPGSHSDGRLAQELDGDGHPVSDAAPGRGPI